MVSDADFNFDPYMNSCFREESDEPLSEESVDNSTGPLPALDRTTP